LKPRLKRKEFPFAALAPNRIMTLLSIVFSIESQDVPSKVLSILQEHRAAYYQGYLQPLDGSIELCIFADVTECVDFEELVRKIEALPGVISVEHTKLKKGFVADTLHFPLTSRGGLRMILFSAEFISMAFKKIHEVFGSGGSVILFESGYEYGKALAESFAKTLLKTGIPRDKIAEAVIQVLPEYGMSVGWYIPVVEPSDFKKPTVTFKVYETFEAEAYKGRPASWGCDFIRGVIKGVFDTLYGKDVEVKEVKCRIKGDEYCEFHIEGK